jgi:hypothetical protein
VSAVLKQVGNYLDVSVDFVKEKQSSVVLPWMSGLLGLCLPRASMP